MTQNAVLMSTKVRESDVSPTKKSDMFDKKISEFYDSYQGEQRLKEPEQGLNMQNTPRKIDS